MAEAGETEKLLDKSRSDSYHSCDDIEGVSEQKSRRKKVEKRTHNATQDDFSVDILGHSKGGCTTGVEHPANDRAEDPGTSRGTNGIEEVERQVDPVLQNEHNEEADDDDNTFINSVFTSVFLVVITLIFILSFSVFKTEVAINFAVSSVINGAFSILDIMAIFFMLTQMFICRSNFHESPPQNELLMFLVLFIFVPMGLLFRLTEWLDAFKIRLCCSPVYIVRLTTDMLFILTASIFTRKLLKHRIIGCRMKVVFTKTAIVMLIVACSCQWLHQLKTEKDHELAENRTRPGVCTNASICEGDKYAQSLTDMKYTLEPYIAPFIVEFAISVVALMYLPFRNAGNNAPVEPVEREFRHFRPVRPIAFIIGIVVFVSCLLTLIFLGTYNTVDEKTHGLAVYYCVISTVFLVAICANILLLIVVWKMEVIACESVADRIVLWITMSGQLLVSLSMIIAAAIELGKRDNQFPKITILNYVIVTFQYTLQTITLDLSLSRRMVPTDANYPVISALQPSFILLLLNFGMWIANLYTKDMQDINFIAEKIFAYNIWPIVDSISYPLSVMQRLHSAVLCYDILLKTA